MDSFIPSSLLVKPTLHTLSIGVGLASSSFSLWGNVGSSIFGLMPLLLKPELRARAGMQPGAEGLVKGFDFFMAGATNPIVASMLVSSLAYLAASTLVPNAGTKDGDAKVNLLRLGAFMAIVPLPWTLVMIRPSITALFSLRPSLATDAVTLSPAATRDAQAAMMKWSRGHTVRMGMYATSWVVGMLALAAA